MGAEFSKKNKLSSSFGKKKKKTVINRNLKKVNTNNNNVVKKKKRIEIQNPKKKKKTKMVKIEKFRPPKSTSGNMNSFPPHIHGICHAWYGFRSGGSCGYCKDKNKDEKKVKISATFHRMKCSMYDSMVQKNWVRCGTYFYTPQNHLTCCPQYQNRLDVRNFKMTSKYRRVMKKVNHWLKTGERRLPKSNNNNSKKKKSTTIDPETDKIIKKVVFSMIDNGTIPNIGENLSFTTKLNQWGSKKKGNEIQEYQLCSNIVFQIFGHLKKNNISSSQINRSDLAKSISDACNNSNNKEKTIFNEIKPHSSGFLHISIPNERFSSLMKKEETEEEVERIKIQKDRIIEEAIDTELRKAEFDEEEFQLYLKFETRIHQKEIKKNHRDHYFKCHIKSPLLYEKRLEGEGEASIIIKEYGSYHYRYRLRKSGRLIAVSVLDMLPSGVFSLYFFHDPDYHFLELGKYSVFHELRAFFSDLRDSEFRYYYFGFYVHSCPKMNYKAQFKPQEVLCNVTWKYSNLERVRKDVLSHTKFGKFFREEEEEEGEEEEDNNNNNINFLILYDRQIVQREIFETLFGALSPSAMKKMTEYRKVMGEWANHLVYVCNKEDLLKYAKKSRRRKKY